jgi:hypothetical protein
VKAQKSEKNKLEIYKRSIKGSKMQTTPLNHEKKGLNDKLEGL